VHRFDGPTCVIVKHANPCGVASASGAAEIADVYARANACDPVSAFGGIVAVNRPVTLAMAEAVAAVFTEVVVAPGYDPAALEVLVARRNLRVLSGPPPATTGLDVRTVDGGLLVQDADPVVVDPDSWSVVSEATPTPGQLDDLAFAWAVCAAVSSNAIVLARDRQAVGIGAGQQNRVDSARIAVGRASGRARGGVAASDAFFPFRDGVDVVAEAGVTAIVQPGGSVRDDEAIAAANEHGIAMVVTGERHFRH
jgi:phosphoribosylaminoimidazolecarboxamide formyltransferase / IMP cyclohydrolase